MIKINNNITLNYIPMSNLKTTSVGVYIYRPLNRDEISANAMLPYVLQRGCRICPTLEKLSKYLDDLYGASLNVGISKNGMVHTMSINGKTISDKYAPDGEKLTNNLTELIMSIMFEPVIKDGAFLTDVFKQEQKSAKDSILALINDKRAYTQRLCIEKMCGDDAYALPKNGTVEGIDALDEKKLYEYYKKIITSSVIDIFVCGDADINAVADTIHDFCDKFDFIDAQIPKQSIFKTNKSQPTEEYKCMDITQGKLCIGLTTDITCADEQYWGLMIANNILGGGAHSKLFNNVREKLSLAYYAGSQLEKNKGLMFINAGIEFDNYQRALDEIYKQIDELKNGNIGDDEFSAAVLAIESALEQYYDDQTYMQLFCVSQRTSGVDYSIDYMKNKIRSVTKEQVTAAAKQINADTVFFLKGTDK